MRNAKYNLIWILLLMGLPLAAQVSPYAGINYQGIARRDDGSLLANQDIRVRLSFSTHEGTEPKETFYSEIHQLSTDDLGIFRFVIGQGNRIGNNTMDDIPWATHNIWLDLDIQGQNNGSFSLVSSTELQTVPYAFFAEKAGALVDEPSLALRNSSIYWTIGGNALTRPPYHFLGTRDANEFNMNTQGEPRMVITEGGQVNLRSGVDGNEDSYEAYALTVQGSKQGIYIKVNGGTEAAKNFMTFADGGPGEGPGTKHGEIEGQTIDELLSSFDYLFTNAIFIIDGIALVATGIGNGAEAAGEAAAGAASIATIILAWAAPGWFTASGADIAKSIALAADAIALAAQAIEYNTNAIANVGVSYSSGSGDYAEWLPRMTGEGEMRYGEIVGVHAGLVSRVTDGADHIKVVSMRPAVLGNAPIEDREKEMEKIAFLGQVPVLISGPASVGDYIVPSGKNDGFGVAVHPDSLATGKFHQIVGVAWEAADDKPVNTILIGVGLHKNKLANRVQTIENKVDMITAYLQGKGPLPEGDGAVPNVLANQVDVNEMTIEQADYILSDQAFEAFIASEGPRIKETFRLAGIVMEEQGYDFSENPQMHDIINDPIEALRNVRNNKTYEKYWKPLESKIKELQSAGSSDE